jgi:mono/diheme cytochrome c family protein
MGVPSGVTATGGIKQVTISWSAVSGATSYNLYWLTAPGVTTATGTKVAGPGNPYVQTGLADGTAYYYIVTALSGADEGPASAEVAATTNASSENAPAAATGVTATGGIKQVTISWSAVSGATSYNLYWSTTPGVTTATGTKIAWATNPSVLTGLADGTAYYCIVTALSGADESPASAQVTATTNPAAAFDALAFYNGPGNCALCHGAPVNFTGGRTATQVRDAMNYVDDMASFNNILTPAQVTAIAALLGQ